MDKFAYVVTVTPDGSLLVNGAPAAPADGDSYSSEALLSWALDQVRRQWEAAGASAGERSLLTVTIDDQRPGGYGRHRTRLRPGQAASIEGLRARTGKNLEHWTPSAASQQPTAQATGQDGSAAPPNDPAAHPSPPAPGNPGPQPSTSTPPTNAAASTPNAPTPQHATSEGWPDASAPRSESPAPQSPRPTTQPNGSAHHPAPQQHWSMPVPTSPQTPNRRDGAGQQPDAASSAPSAAVATATSPASVASPAEPVGPAPSARARTKKADRSKARSRRPKPRQDKAPKVKPEKKRDATRSDRSDGGPQKKSLLASLFAPKPKPSEEPAQAPADGQPPRPGWTRYTPRIQRPRLPEPEKAEPKQRESPVKMIMVVAATLLVAILVFSVYQRATQPDSYAAVCVDQRTASRVNTDAPCEQRQAAYFRWWYVPAGSAVPAVGAPVDPQQGSFIEPTDSAPVRYGYAPNGGVYKQPKD